MSDWCSTCGGEICFDWCPEGQAAKARAQAEKATREAVAPLQAQIEKLASNLDRWDRAVMWLITSKAKLVMAPGGYAVILAQGEQTIPSAKPLDALEKAMGVK